VTLPVLCLALVLAAVVPSLLAMNVPPSPTLLNQAAAWACWGLVATYATRRAVLPLSAAGKRSAPLWAALLLVAASALGAWWFGALPFGLAASSAGTVLGAAALAVLGAAMAPQRAWWPCWFGAWAVSATLNGVAGAVQVFAPAWADGEWIARASSGGRAVGNLRQPNHLASLLLWGAVSVLALVELGTLGRSAARRAVAALVFSFLIAAVMLTGSRTGMVGVALLALWGLLDRRLSRFARALLWAAPVVFAAAWGLGTLWSSAHEAQAIGAAQRVGQAEVTSGRRQTWSNALVLIAQQPLAGTGLGEFNLAWTLTPFGARWPEFFDHTHNLPLQVLAEMGLLAGGLVLVGLALSLWKGFVRAGAVEGADGAAARAFLVTVLLMVLHSMLEYPLWYAYFLLPTAFVGGVCLGIDAPPRPPRDTPALGSLALGVALVLGAGAMAWDYRRVSAIFAPSEQDERTLVERIHDGQRSWFFAHHADYARLTALEEVAPPSTAEFRRATHYLLDTRLLTAWARAYAREGDVERARWIADRLRELKQPSAEPFFKPCTDPAVTAKPFQCTPASTVFDWREFN
jgi:O-antigen ligase